MRLEPSSLAAVMRGEVRADEPLARHTTIRIGGPARLYALPRGEEDVRQALLWVREQRAPWRTLGLGSNLLCPDEGFDGLVLDLGLACADLRFEGSRVHVGAGFHLARLIQQAAARGLSGLEGVAGVPGTVGGALAMNAGTAAGETGAVVERVRVLDLQGQVHEFSAAEMRFAYRHSRLQDEPLVALGAVLRLIPGDPEAIRADLSARAARRRQSQPLELPNSGSIWRNPPGDFAGRLVEAAGCRGLREGGAQVSPKHGNFIVNLGGARARDVLALMVAVRGRVLATSGVLLHPELRWLPGQEEFL